MTETHTMNGSYFVWHSSPFLTAQSVVCYRRYVGEGITELRALPGTYADGRQAQAAADRLNVLEDYWQYMTQQWEKGHYW